MFFNSLMNSFDPPLGFLRNQLMGMIHLNDQVNFVRIITAFVIVELKLIFKT